MKLPAEEESKFTSDVNRQGDTPERRSPVNGAAGDPAGHGGATHRRHGRRRRLATGRSIHYRRGNVTIINRRGLIRHACECYAVSKKEFDRCWASGQRAGPAPNEMIPLERLEPVCGTNIALS